MMDKDKFCYNDENEYRIIDSQCEVCSFLNLEQKKCIFYKDGIPKKIMSNKCRCEYQKIDSVLDDIDENYEYYSKLYFKNFGKKAFITPGGSKKQTIEIVKKSLVENKDLLEK